MATISLNNGDDYLMKLSRLEATAKDEICGKAIYGAAALVADAIRAELQSMPTDESWGTTESPNSGPRKKQVAGLEQSLGIAKMEDDGSGYLNVKIGFDGYNDIKTKRWPNGQPNNMVARSIGRGTSFMNGNAFVKRAVAKTRKQALSTMQKSVEESIEKIMK